MAMQNLQGTKQNHSKVLTRQTFPPGENLL